MIPSNPLDQNSAYVDFSQFGKLKKDSRENKDAALEATAKQLESVFLNMMLKSMREANSVFSDGNYLTTRDTQFYQDMYDHQLSLDLASHHGVGLAEMIVKQMKSLQDKNHPMPQNENGYSISSQTGKPLPVALQAGNDARRMLELKQDWLKVPVEQQVFAPVTHATVDPSQSKPEVPATATGVTDASVGEAGAGNNDDRWQSAEEFVQKIWPHAQRAAKQLNVDPKAIVAQAVLETGWGQHSMTDEKGNPSFNLFGIKADSGWQGDVVRKKTLEYRNGIAAPEFAAFRSYSSLQDAFDDYVKFLKGNSRYESIFMPDQDASNWGFALQKAGYATDPKYGNKIASILESDVLQSNVDSKNKTL